ncbi:MAG: hypothetical protein M1816_005195 [Peltula sp. TS41687]|nr:MAG: hypothetical protein M1816_005195 [Peltula sp. TS41687]
MAASISFTSAPRRKLATYGKPSRKRIDGFGIENEHPRSTASSASYGRETQSIFKWQDVGIRAPVISAGNGVGPGQTDNRQRTGPRTASDTNVVRATDAKCKPAQRSSFMEAVVIESPPPKKPQQASGLVFAKAPDELRVFDFLSSDEETQSKKAAMVSPRLAQQRDALVKRSTYTPLSRTKITGLTGGKRSHAVPDQSRVTPSKKRKLGAHYQEDSQSIGFKNQNAQQQTSVFLSYRASKRDCDDTDESLDSPVVKTPRTPMTNQVPVTAKSPSFRNATGKPTKTSGSRAGPSLSFKDPIQPRKEGNSTSSRTGWHKRQTSSTRTLPQKPRPVPQLPRCGSSVADIGGQRMAPALSTPPNLRRAQSAIETPSTTLRGIRLHVDEEATPRARPVLHSISPRHTELWGQLLQGSVADNDPDMLPVKRLDFSSARLRRESMKEADATHAAQIAATNGDSDKGRPRRLIDSLKTRPLGEANIEQSESSETETNDTTSVESATQSFDSKSMRGEQGAMKSFEDITTNSQAYSQTKTSQTLSGLQPVGPKVTYAHQRSYLTETSLDEELFSQTPPNSQFSSYSQAHRGGGMGAPVSLSRLSSFAEEEDVSSTGNIKSIHELREAGGAKRFMNEIEGILEDIDDRSASSMSTRRTSLLELARKLSQKSNARRFLDLGLNRRLFNQLDTADDIISSCAFASIMLHLSREGMETHSLLHICQAGAFEMLTRLLRIDQDVTLVAKDKRNGLSRVSQALVSDFRILVTQLPCWTTAPEQVSPRAIGLITFENLLRSLREAGDTYHTLSPESIDVILSVIDRMPGFGSNQPLSAQEMQEIETAISIFDACTMTSGLKFGSSAQEAAWTLTITKWLLFVTGDLTDELKQIQLTVLRLVLNVTNNSSSLCDTLSSPAVIRALAHTIDSEFHRQAETLDRDDEDVYSIDYLILTLATITNLLERSDNIRKHILDEQIDGTSVLDALLQHFLRGLKRTAEADSMEETHFNVAFGYLSVLLSSLCLRDDMRPPICSRMPGQTIQPILGAAIEFLDYHQLVDSQMSESDRAGAGAQDGFTVKLREMIERLMDA